MSSEPRAHALDKFVLRMPDGMREKIGIAARENHRPMNAEIVSRLEASFSASPKPVLVVNENTHQADIIVELHDAMKGLKAEFTELKASLMRRSEGVGGLKDYAVPDFVTPAAILETREMVRALLEAFRAQAQSPTMGRPNE